MQRVLFPCLALLAAGVVLPTAAAPSLFGDMGLLGQKEPVEPPRARAADLFPPATEGFVIPGPGDAEWSVGTLLQEFSRVTGYHLVTDAQTDQILEQTAVGVKSQVPVPPAAVYSVTESILRQKDFVIALMRGEEPRMMRVATLQSSARATLREHAVLVPEGELEPWRGHPAVLITTTVTLPYTDVRTLSNSLRTLLTDANVQQIVPVGSSNSLLLSGFGSWVHSYAAMLYEIDARAEKAAMKRGESDGSKEGGK